VAGRFFVCLFVCIGLLALSFSRQQQDGDKGVERATQDQNSVYDLFAILVRVDKHCDAPPEETYKDGKEEYRARELLVHNYPVLDTRQRSRGGRKERPDRGSV